MLVQKQKQNPLLQSIQELVIQRLRRARLSQPILDLRLDKVDSESQRALQSHNSTDLQRLPGSPNYG
jgi:hypothetical protein